MRCLKYEFRKIGKKRTFLALTVLLLAANLLAVFMTERNTSSFTLVFEQRENYEAFLAGNTSADINGYYSQEAESQKVYQDSYPEFITGMTKRVEQMAGLSIFADKDTFAYRNMLRTCEDYEKFSDAVLKEDNCFGIRAFARYQTGVLFMLVFLAVLTYYVIFFERDKNLLLLVKGTRKGHAPTAGSKLAVMVLVAVAYTILQEILVILLTGFLYGYGDPGRLLQSVPEFRNCTYFLTVGEGLFAIVAIRSAVAVVFACVFFCVAMCVKNEMAASVLSVGTAGILFFVSRAFSVNGPFDWLACVNPFYCWDMKSMLGEYHNLNVMGMPVYKDFCTSVAAVILVAVLSAAGIFVYCRTCQTRSGSRLDDIMQKVRKAAAFFNQRTSLLYYEFYKMLIQQKKLILLAVVIIFGIRESAAVLGTQYYPTVEEVSYHYYIGRYEGRITEDTLQDISEEEDYLNGLAEEIAALGDNPTGDAYARRALLEAELMKKEPGFTQVQMQVDGLREKDGKLFDKYLVDELAYNERWNDTQGDVITWLIGAIILIILLGGLNTMDEKRKMTGLLRSARLGRKKLERSRTVCAVICTVIVYGCMEIPLFLEYCRAGLFHVFAQRLTDFTVRSFHVPLTVGVFVTAVFIFKAVAYLAVCIAELKISKFLKSEMPVLLICSGAVGVVAVILYRLAVDIEMLLIYIL